MVNQPIPFKEHSTKPKSADASPPADEIPPDAGRPPGELGGHTVQPWEQDSVPPTTTPNSKDVPPPELGTKEAAAAGTGPGKTTTKAPGNKPSSTPGTETVETDDEDEGAAPVAAPGATRPPRPGKAGAHAPAPRPSPGQAPQGPGTAGDALVEAVSKAIAENLAKALHQSVAQAVRDVMALSGNSVASPAPSAATTGKPAPTAQAPAQPAREPGGGKPDKGTGAAKAPGPASPGKATTTDDPAPASTPTNAEPSETGEAGAQPSQYGGTIEPPVPEDEVAAPKS